MARSNRRVDSRMTSRNSADVRKPLSLTVTIAQPASLLKQECSLPAVVGEGEVRGRPLLWGVREEFFTILLGTCLPRLQLPVELVHELTDEGAQVLALGHGTLSHAPRYGSTRERYEFV